MAIVFLQADGVPITAQAERQGSAALYGGGSGRQLGGRSGFRVGTPADTLTATSTTWTLKPCSAMIDPGASTHQGMYGWASDANITGTVDPSDATYARKDIIFIQINDSSAGDGSGATTATVRYVAGSATATPTAPALGILDRTRSFLVGTIDVPKTGAGSPTVTLNPVRFAAAGAPISVGDDTELAALDKYAGLQVCRRDKNGRIDTWNGATWWWIGKTDSFTRAVAGDSNPGDIAGIANLVTGTIPAAPAGNYRISGRACLYATSGTSRGYVFVAAGTASDIVGGTAFRDEARTDFPGDSNPHSWPAEVVYTHAGGDLTVSVGYRQTAGSPLVTGVASGTTRVTATLLGN